MPPWLSVIGDLLLVLSFWMVYRVFKENAFGASTVRIVEGQKVISTGPYAIVRNPMSDTIARAVASARRSSERRADDCAVERVRGSPESPLRSCRSRGRRG